MINKFQLGGKQDVIMLFVLGLALTLQADPNQIILIAQLNPDALKNAVQVYQQTLDMNQAAQAFQQTLQQQVLAAKHGAKLKYLKSLKHKCAEDEELIYYKKGGSIDCGCVKKAQDGTKTQKPKTIKDKFKEDRAIRDSIAANKYNDQEVQTKRPGNYVTKNGKTIWVPDRTKAPYNKTDKKENGGLVKKDCGGSKLKLVKKGGEVCPKCGKVHKAGIGCNVASFKAMKHLNGGSLNGIPFIKKAQ